MFCDEAKIMVRAGKGGNGIVSMRREIYEPRGGPDGGDGGKGGDVVLLACHNENTLANFKGTYLFKAPWGGNGGNQDKHGKNGEDLILKVPVGTLVRRAKDNKVIFDLDEDDSRAIVARGGRGGFGNCHFKSSLHKAPFFAELGEPGEEGEIILELKLVADVGIIGLPSVGKSTFISVVSNSKPKIAEYHFTTLIPNLGVVNIDEDCFVMADIPGLIEGASDGKGLGNRFLKHIERCRFLIHMLDINSSDMYHDYLQIREELTKYSKILAKKKELIAINKIDSVDDDLLEMILVEFKKNFPSKFHKNIFAISAVAKKNTKELLRETAKMVRTTKRKRVAVKKTTEYKVYKPHLEMKKDEWIIEEENKVFTVRGPRIEQIVKMTNFQNEQGVLHLRDVLKKKKILKDLIKKGWKIEDKLFIGEVDCSGMYAYLD